MSRAEQLWGVRVYATSGYLRCTGAWCGEKMMMLAFSFMSKTFGFF